MAEQDTNRKIRKQQVAISLTTFIILTPLIVIGQITTKEINSTCKIKTIMTRTDFYEDENRIQILKQSKGNIEISLISDGLKYFEEPVFFRFNGNNFIRIHEIYSGTGYANNEFIYLIDNNCNFAKVEIIEASDIEARMLPDSIRIMKGEFREFRDNEITFYFGLWHKDDPNCCPSIGWILGTYEIVQENKIGNSKLVMRQKERQFKKDL